MVHTYPGKYDAVYEPLLGLANFAGPSLQMGNMKATHAETLKWVSRSAAAGRKWFVSLDEIGPANAGVLPDKVHVVPRLRPAIDPQDVVVGRQGAELVAADPQFHDVAARPGIRARSRNGARGADDCIAIRRRPSPGF